VLSSLGPGSSVAVAAVVRSLSSRLAPAASSMDADISSVKPVATPSTYPDGPRSSRSLERRQVPA
jgi:hypothetical protein